MTELLQVWPRELTLDNLAETRAASDEQLYARTIEEHVGQRPFDYFERDIAGPDGAPIRLACYRPSASEGTMPAFLYLHSGGLVSGNRFAEDLRLLDLALGASRDWSGFGALSWAQRAKVAFSDKPRCERCSFK